MRVGIGYDVHRLVTGRELILGGKKIAYDKGLLGHSDADVLVHAICDALLGAAGLGDIGQHFPDSSPKYKNCFSIDLLVQVYRMVASAGLRLVNLDATIFAQAPKLTPHKADMEKNIACALNTTPERINIKATTTEGLGPVGRQEGLAAMCIVLLQNIPTNAGMEQ